MPKQSLEPTEVKSELPMSDFGLVVRKKKED